MMDRPFILVPDRISTETVKCLEQLLANGRDGSLIGLGYMAMLSNRGYIVNTAGEVHRNPTFARGMLCALDDQLAKRIRGIKK